MNNSVPMSSPDITQAEIEAVIQVLQSGRLSIGPQLDAFEAAVAAYVGTRYAVGVNSGTSGLHLAIVAAGVQAGDLVITTPFSFIASANCILYEGGIPVFVDVDPITGNIDPRYWWRKRSMIWWNSLSGQSGGYHQPCAGRS